FQAEDGIRDRTVTGVQTCALPILCRNSPDNCQPPITASRNPCALGAKARPFPNGSSAIQLALNWCVASKSDTARNALGSQELMICPLNPPHCPMRSASELMSMDFENV